MNPHHRQQPIGVRIATRRTALSERGPRHRLDPDARPPLPRLPAMPVPASDAQPC